MTVLLGLCLLLGVGMMAAPFLNRESPAVRTVIVYFGIAMIIRYMLWRTLATLPPLEFSWVAIIAYPFFALDIISNYLWIKDLQNMTGYRRRSKQVDEQLDWYGKELPEVAALIPTYNEPWEVLEKTLVGIKNQNYANYTIWVLDDGKRDWLREKAEERGVGYLTRPDNKHHKAGNLNHGIEEIRRRGHNPEFIAVLDADFIGRPEFLRRTMALMQDPKVGIVQTPQTFYNPDPHQQAFGGTRWWPDEQRTWFDEYLPSLDAIGGVTCCGTSCLHRLKALDAIGLFPTESVTEDTLSSFKMSAKGYATVFLSEPLTVGLAPEGLGEFLTQRARWLLGGVQCTQLFGPGPTLWGKFMYYLWLWRSAIFGIMNLSWIALLSLFWFTGVWIIETGPAPEALTYFLPLLVHRIFDAWMCNGRRMPFVSDAVWTLLAPLWIRENFRAVTKAKNKFRVTDKAVKRGGITFHWQFVRVHVVLALILGGGMVYNLVDATAPAHRHGPFQAASFLTIYFLLGIATGVAPALESPKRRDGERYPANEAVQLRLGESTVEGRCVELSMTGMLVHVPRAATLPHEFEAQVDGLGWVGVRLVRRLEHSRVALAFGSQTERPALIRKLFFTDDYIRPPSGWSLGRSVAAAVRRAVF